jgi:hypothetical protein
MIALSVGYFVAGALLGVWILHLAEAKNSEATTVRSTDLVPASSSPMSASTHESGAAAFDYLPNKYTGKVVSVTDGDTIDVALVPNGLVQAIRLEGIDAPESAQPFGSQSAQHLSELVSGKAVTLECENERSYPALTPAPGRPLVGLEILVCQVADLMIDMKQAFLIRHVRLEELALQNVISSAPRFADGSNSSSLKEWSC